MKENGNKLRVVVIGGVAAGLKAAAKVRRSNPQASVTVLEKGELVSYGSCGLPYYIAGKFAHIHELMATPTGTLKDPAYFRAVKNLDVRTRTIAQKIDRAAKLVYVQNLVTGEQYTLTYDKLVLATGARPVTPPIAGVGLENVFTLWHPHDAVKIREGIDAGRFKKAVIIGAGLIGMEMCEALVERGLNVDLVEMREWVMPAFLDFEMAAQVMKHLAEKGVALYMGEKVLRLEGESAVTKVVTEQRELPADLVLLAVGVKPNADLARDAGLTIGPAGGIAVNEWLQTSDPDIYAGGDCVENVHLITGEKVYAPMGSTANKHGRIIGENICGARSRFPGVLGTVVAKVFDLTVGKVGLTENDAARHNYDYLTVLAPGYDKAHYYPGSKTINIKLVVDVPSRRVLGAQIVGPGEVAKRLDVLATAITLKGTLEDMANLDLAYAPPFNNPLDNVAVAANVAMNKLAGVVDSVTPMEVKYKLGLGKRPILLDVRSPQEFAEVCLDDDCNVKLLPLGKLRERLAEIPQNEEIIAFCKLSLRGYEAALILKGAAYRNVKYMEGGILGWPYQLKQKDKH